MLAANLGDFNYDLQVDGSDFLLWQRNVGEPLAANVARLDHDNSGAIDGGDLAAWQGSFGATYTTPANTAPTLGPIDDQTMRVDEDRLTIPLQIGDAEGDFLQFAARASAANPLAELRDAYGLAFRGSYFVNVTGLNEKWLFGDDGAGLLLLPNGDLLKWQNSYADTAQRESLIARLDPAVYEDPSLLWDAEAEVVAPANVFVEDGTLVVDPHEGVAGEMLIRLAVSDGLEFAIQEFTVTVTPDQPTFDDELALVEQLQIRAANLSYAEIPDFLTELSDAAGALDGIAAARAYDLLRQLDQLYERSQLDAQASSEWEAEQQRLLARDLEQAKFIEAELKILNQEFSDAWANIRDNVANVTPVDPTLIPPIFINGTNPGPFTIEQGRTIELDMRAIHPFGIPDVEIDWVDGPGSSFISYGIDSDTSIFDWTPSIDNPPGAYHFRFEAEAQIDAREEDYPGFTLVTEGEWVYAYADVVINVTPAVQPTIDSLKVSPTVITDSQTDPIVLTALGVAHPTDTVDYVRFWQDRNGNQTFEYGQDYDLGFDLDGSDGWSTVAIPQVEAGDESITVLAHAVRLAGMSEAVETTIGVIPAVQLPDSLVVPLGIDDSLFLGNSSDPAAWRAYFAGDDYVSVSKQGSTLYARWYEEDQFGVRPVSDEILLLRGRDIAYGAHDIDDIDVAADAEGNLVVIAGIHGSFEDVIGGVFAARPPRSGGTFVDVFVENYQTQYLPVEDDQGNPVFDEYGDRVYESDPTPRGGAFNVSADINDGGQGFVTWDYEHRWRNSDEDESIEVDRETNFIPFAWEYDGSQYSVDADYSQPLLHDEYAFADWSPLASSTFGGRSLASISNDGKVAVLWPSGSGPSYLATAPTPYSAFTFRPVELTLWPTHIAMDDSGWVVVGGDDQFALVSPAGSQVGPAYYVSPWINGRPSMLISRLDFEADGTLAIDHQNSFYYDRFRFDVNVADGVILQSIDRVDTSDLHAGDAVEVDVTIVNSQQTAVSDLVVGFWLSRDEVLDAATEIWQGQAVSADRAIGYHTIDALAPGESRTVRVTLTLPENLDPFYIGGAVDLNLIGAVTNSGSALPIPIPFIIAQYDPFGASPGRGFGQPQPQTGVYIRPNIAASQVSNPSHVTAVDTMELIGRQMASGLRTLERQAPPVLRARIESMRQEVELAMDAYFQKKWDSVAAARDEALSQAEYQRTIAQQAADGILQRGQDREVNALAGTVGSNQAEIDLELATANTQVAQAANIRDAKIAAANKDVSEAEAALEAHSNPQDGFALGVFEKIIDKAQDIAEDIGDAFQERWDELKDFVDRARDVAAGIIDKATEVFTEAFNKIQSAFNKVVQPFKDAIQFAEQIYDTAIAKLSKSWEDAHAAAEELYQDAVASANESFADTLQAVKADAGPLFDSLNDKIDGAVSMINADITGIVDQIGDELGDLSENNPFGNIVEIVADSATASVDIALESLGNIGDALAPAVSVIKDSGGEFADWSKDTGGVISDWTQDRLGEVTEWVEDKVDDVLEAEAIAYKTTTELDLSINLLNGSTYANVTLGPGLQFDTRKLKELLAGEITLPDIDPLEAATSLYGVEIKETTNYDSVKAQQQAEFGAQNVYFASSRFAAYFGTETIAEIALEALVDGGTDALKETAEQLRLELNDILAFLSMQGEAELANVGANILNALINQTDLAWPHIELRWTPVTYRYDIEPTGMLGQLYDTITSQEDLAELIGDRPLSVDSQHAAFTIIWKPADVPNPLDPAHIDAQLQLQIDQFTGRQLGAQPLDPSLTASIMDGLEGLGAAPIVLDLAQAMLGRVNGMVDIEAEFANFLSDQLNVSESDLLAAYTTGAGTVDLHQSVIAGALRNVLEVVTFGNQGSVEIDTLTFDLASYSLTAEITLCHQHSWGSVGDILDQVGL